ncbi:hypothetical protein [Agrobacterium sp. P15N1-A]|uniref:hypothetical protein n=1 Tax=Agrobacterium sp. P15N1-A TaxID=3342820 RepID=UPI0037DC8C0F
MKKKPNWKTTFQAGMFACAELRKRKIHRDLLSYITFKADQAMRVCWSSQAEIADVLDCSVRNVHGLLTYLERIGAIYPAPFAHLPKGHQARIRSLTPNKATANAKVYYLSEKWALDELASGEVANRHTTGLPISEQDRERGRIKANERRRRYAPFDSKDSRDVATDPALEEWLFMNAIPSWTGSPTSTPDMGWTGSPTTDMSMDNTTDPTTGVHNRNGEPLPSKAQITQVTNSSLTSSQTLPSPSEYDAARARGERHGHANTNDGDKTVTLSMTKPFPKPKTIDEGRSFLVSRGCPTAELKRCLERLMDGDLTPFDIEDWDLSQRVRA